MRRGAILFFFSCFLTGGFASCLGAGGSGAFEGVADFFFASSLLGAAFSGFLALAIKI